LFTNLADATMVASVIWLFLILVIGMLCLSPLS
jgi:hypothetical protein